MNECDLFMTALPIEDATLGEPCDAQGQRNQQQLDPEDPARAFVGGLRDEEYDSRRGVDRESDQHDSKHAAQRRQRNAVACAE